MTCRWLIKIIIDNSQDMKKKRYKLLCPEASSFARHRSTFTKKPIRNLHHHLDLEQFHPQENPKKKPKLCHFAALSAVKSVPWYLILWSAVRWVTWASTCRMETQKKRSSNWLSRVCRQGDTVRSVSKNEMNSQIAIRGKRYDGSTSYPIHIDMHR